MATENESDNKEENEKKSGVREFSVFLLQVDSEFAQLFFKAMLLMNSGALVSLLIAISRSDDRAIDIALIDGSSWFGYGLTLTVVGLMFYSPYTEEVEELKEHFKKNTRTIYVSALCIFLAVGAFLYGVWDTIGNLKGALKSA